MSGAPPKSFHVELGTSLFCADTLSDSSVPQMQYVTLNDGATLGSFAGDLSACTCSAPRIEHSFEASAAAAIAVYRPGSTNHLRLTGSNRCLGMMPSDAWNGAVARVVVTY